MRNSPWTCRTRGRARRRRARTSPGISRSDDVSQTFVRRHGGDRRRFSAEAARRFGFDRVHFGATFESVGSCPASEEDAPPRERDGVDAIDGRFGFPGDRLGSVELRRRRARARGFARRARRRPGSPSPSPSRERPRTRRRGDRARKKLSDCLRVPPRTGLVCPRDLASPPRPNTCPAPPSGDARDAVLSLVAEQIEIPTGAGPPRRRRDATAGDATRAFRVTPAAPGRRHRVSTRRRRRRARDAAVIRRGVARHARAGGGSPGSFGVPTSGDLRRRGDARDAPSVTLRYVACVAEDGSCVDDAGSAEVDVSARPIGSAVGDLVTRKNVRSEDTACAGSIPLTSLTGRHEFAEHGSRRDAVLRRSGTVSVDGVSRVHRADLGHARHERVHGAVRRRAVSHVVRADGRDAVPPAKPRPAADHLLHPEHVRRVRRSTGGDARVQGVGRHAVLHPARRAGGSRGDSRQSSPRGGERRHSRRPSRASPNRATRCAAGLRGRVPTELRTLGGGSTHETRERRGDVRGGEQERPVRRGGVRGVVRAREVRGEVVRAVRLARDGRRRRRLARILQLPTRVVNLGGVAWRRGARQGVPDGARPGETPRRSSPRTPSSNTPGRIRFVPEKGTPDADVGRPYGGSGGAIRFRANDGVFDSDNVGTVSFAVNTAPTVASSAFVVREGNSIVVDLDARDVVDCPSGSAANSKTAPTRATFARTSSRSATAGRRPVCSFRRWTGRRGCRFVATDPRARAFPRWTLAGTNFVRPAAAREPGRQPRARGSRVHGGRADGDVQVARRRTLLGRRRDERGDVRAQTARQTRSVEVPTLVPKTISGVPTSDAAYYDGVQPVPAR